jgi:hypothetical protein
MIHYVIKAKYVKDYKIEITFEDKKTGIVDLKETIFNDKRPIFQELKDKNKFSQIKVAMDSIVWQNGLDLSPEFLYKMI